jgi:hypothetical protein
VKRFMRGSTPAGVTFAGVDAERPGQLHADDHAEFPGPERVEVSRHHLVPDLGNFRFFLGQDALDRRALRLLVANRQPFPAEERRDPLDLRMASHFRGHRTPVLEAPRVIHDCGMRGHAENAFLEFLLEPVHDRQHGDQGHDAECYADHGGQRDEGDEMIAALRPDVPQPDEGLERPEHAGHYTDCLPGLHCRP